MLCIEGGLVYIEGGLVYLQKELIHVGLQAVISKTSIGQLATHV